MQANHSMGHWSQTIHAAVKLELDIEGLARQTYLYAIGSLNALNSKDNNAAKRI